MMIFYIFLTYFSLMMFFLKHPLSMGLLILIQTFLICLISGLYIYTYWFSYILFLTFLGGLLVLFIYVSSIASNELFKFKFNNKMLLMLMLMMMILLFIFFMMKFNWMNLLINSFNLEKYYNYLIIINNNNNINLTKLYNEQTYLLMIMMIIYLFITLIAVVKITNIFYGPLRSN
uniref:NADH-ubiquinone oxidoreductase chain 6 n=1 Tax=Capila neolineata TaxID=3078206 RepID=A0AA96HSI3_9NEOP|nr:NADH dehydrogenase subunit 6 [Capila neolineata]WNO18754.1 NADH dehydrogenase subunit 6 [Capila neolineata]